MRNITLSQLTNKANTKETTCLSKKRKNTSPLKQTDRFTSHTDLIKYIKRGVQMLEKAKTHLAKNETSLLEQAITLIQHTLAHTQPEPSLKEKFATFTTSLNKRLGRMEATFASRSPTGSQASLAGSANMANRGNTRNNTLMSYATAANYRGSTTFSGNDFITVPSSRTNNGFITVQYTSRNQSKTASPRSFTD
jgi:hypothetical protein